MESIGQLERRALTAANIPEPLRSLVGFAAKSAAALRQESSSLAKLRNPNPFFAILSSLLSNVEERLENATSLSEERILKLLATLERLAKWPTSFKAPGRPSNENAYPRLTLTIDSRPQLARRCIKALSESAIAINDRKKFERAFKAFANVKPAPRGPELSELTGTTTEPKSNSNNTAAQCLQKLYKTLCQICRCSVAVSEDSFMANVMADYEARSAVADSITIQSFFLHRHHIENNETNEKNEWKETRIRVLVKRYDVETSCDIQDSQRVLDFCKHLRSQELCCLKLRASGHALFHDGIELPTHRISLRTPSVSLANVLTSVILNKDSQRKLHLSFLLAKAVWQFYDSDWIAEAWSKHEVQFMRQCVEGLQDKVLLNHRPFISARFRDDVTQGTSLIQEQAALANTPRQSHIFPKILALGITLLEIELGEGIESRYRSDFLDRDGRPRANAAHVTAGEFITSDMWKRNTKTFLPVKQAIEACVKPDTSLLGVDPSCVRENLHRHVVEPLGKLFGIAYECGGRPEEFDPGPMDFGPSQDTYDNFPPTPDSTEMQKEGGSPKVAVVEADVYEIIGSENREASSFARELHIGDNIIGGHASLNCQQITSQDSHEPTCRGTQLRSVMPAVGRLFHSETIESHQDIIHAKEFFKDLKHFRRTIWKSGQRWNEGADMLGGGIYNKRQDWIENPI